MFFFPITRPGLDRFPGVQPFEGKSFKFVLRSLVRVDETRNIVGNGESRCFGSFAKSRLNCWIDSDGHDPPMASVYRCCSLNQSRELSQGRDA